MKPTKRMAPSSAWCSAILEGVQHTDPDVRGFFINYVRDRESRREIPF
jgi:hypothetical protein